MSTGNALRRIGKVFGLFKGLKSNIISTLIVVVGLGMVMTVVVTTVFWERDILQREVISVRNQLSLLYGTCGKQISADDSADFSGSSKEKLAAIVQATGALVGRVSLQGEVIRFPDSGEEKQQVNLRRVVQQAIATGTTQKQLLGPGWGFMLPVNKQLGVAEPIVRHDKVVGAVGVLIPLSQVYASLAGVYRIIFVYLLVNLLVLVVIGLFRFMAIIVHPVEKLVRMTDAYEEDGVPFLSFQSGGQFEQLSHSLNKMLGRIETDRKKLQSTVDSLQQANAELVATRREVVRAEKLASVGRLAAGLAHEIGNPIGVVLGYLELLKQQDLDPMEREDFANRSENELQRINSLVRQLLDFSRIHGGNKERFSLHELLYDIIELMESQPLMRAIQIRVDFSSPHDQILANADQIRQVFVNCFLNSADAMEDCGDGEKTLTIATRKLAADDDSWISDKTSTERIEVCVTDTGTGIEEENIDSVFDPFFTTKEPGRGTGLGLSVAYSIVEDCGGTMKVKSSAGKGTTVIVILPLA